MEKIKLEFQFPEMDFDCCVYGQLHVVSDEHQLLNVWLLYELSR